MRETYDPKALEIVTEHSMVDDRLDTLSMCIWCEWYECRKMESIITDTITT